MLSTTVESSQLTVDSFTTELVSDASAELFSQQYSQLYKSFAGATESGGAIGGCEFRKNLPIIVRICFRGKISVFWHNTFELIKVVLPGTRSLPFNQRYCEAVITLIQQKLNHRRTSIGIELSRTEKVEIHLANEGSGLAFFGTDLIHFFGSNVGEDFWVLLREKGPHKPVFSYDIVRIHFLMIYTDLIEYKLVGDAKTPMLRCFLLISKPKPGDILTTAQYMNDQTFS